MTTLLKNWQTEGKGWLVNKPNYINYYLLVVLFVYDFLFLGLTPKYKVDN